jgi:hypothetical protein
MLVLRSTNRPLGYNYILGYGSIFSLNAYSIRYCRTAMPLTKYLPTSEELLKALEEIPSDVDTPEELMSSDVDLEARSLPISRLQDLQTRNQSPVPSTSREQNLVSSDSETGDKIGNASGRVWKTVNNAREYPRGFSKDTGVVQQQFVATESPTDVFLKLMDATVMDNIMFQTNLYINQKQRSVKPVAMNESYSFLGLQFLLRISLASQGKNVLVYR